MTIELGAAVRYPQTNWTKVGTVVEIGEGAKSGRTRVLWDRWEYPSGTIRKDGKRTWVKTSALKGA